MFFEQLARVKQLNLDPRELTAQVLLLHLARLHEGQWLSSPRKKISGGNGTLALDLDLGLKERAKQKLRGVGSAREVFNRFYLRGVVLDAHEGFVGWSEKRYPLELLHRIPSPEEMLEIQCEGRRFVTLLLKDQEQLRTYDRHADAAAFCLHDFEHAHKFFGGGTFSAQKNFFRLLRRNLHLLQWNDAQFVKDLNYLKSDMNSHPVHLLKFLKAIVLSAAIRASGTHNPELDCFWSEFFAAWEMNSEEAIAAMNLNQPSLECVKDQVRVHDFFAN